MLTKEDNMKQHKFEHYYNQYKNMIHYLLQRYQIKYGYEDYYQLLLIKLWTEIERYDFSKTASLDKYLYTKLKYYLIDCIRKQSKDSYRILPTSNHEMLDQSFIQTHQFETFSMLEILSQDELMWLKLTLQSFSTQEIAIYLNKSESSIKYYRKNARRKLKSHFLI